MNNHVHLHVCILCTFTLHTYIHTDMCLDVTNFVHETLTERSSKTVRQYVQTLLTTGAHLISNATDTNKPETVC